MEIYSQEIIDNIKQEPEIHFLVVLPDDQETSEESDETLQQTNSKSELQVNVRKFNARWKKTKVNLFKTYFICGKCDYVDKNPKNLEKHFERCTRNEIKCSFCDQKFSKNGRKTHELQEHRKGSSWQCNQCPYNTLVRMNLRHHHLFHFKNFSCETCEKKFAMSYKLREHQIQKRHGVYVKHEITRLDCDECVKTFATKYRLHMHKNKVHGRKNVHCDLCGKTLKNKQNVRSHMNIHIKVPCKICRKLIGENQRTTHMKSLHSTKSFLACRIPKCKRKFSYIEQLNEHQLIHIGTKRYKCPTCNFTTKFLNDINNHMKSKSH